MTNKDNDLVLLPSKCSSAQLLGLPKSKKKETLLRFIIMIICFIKYNITNIFI